jgi:hypothetical protein
MTEQEWLGCKDPKPMLRFLADQGKATERKYRLFSCACCQRVWDSLTDERSRRAVTIAERFADGLASEEELQFALAEAAEVRGLSGMPARWAAVAVARTGALRVVDTAGQVAASPAVGDYDPARWEEEWERQCDLLRDLFGPLPFRPVTVEAGWRTQEVAAVIEAINEGKDFGRVAELGEVLYRAGCRQRDLLHHCLWATRHVHGCWVLDLLLGKE